VVADAEAQAAPSDHGALASISGVAIAAAALIALMVVVAVAVKIYDATCRRESEGLALQSRLFDAFKPIAP